VSNNTTKGDIAVAKRGDNNWREIYWHLSQIGDWVWVVGQSRNGYSQLALARDKAAEKRWFRIQIDTTWQGDFWRERFQVIRIAEPTRRRKAVGA
jgi:hypothetical protein